MMIPQRCIVAKFSPHLFAICNCPYEPKRTSHPSGPSQADTEFTRRALHDFWLHLGDRVASAVDGARDRLIIPSPGAYAS